MPIKVATTKEYYCLSKKYKNILLEIFKNIIDTNIFDKLYEDDIIKYGQISECGKSKVYHIIYQKYFNQIHINYETLFENIKLNLNIQDLKQQQENLNKINKSYEKFKKKYDLSTLYSVSTMGIFLSLFSLVSFNMDILKNISNKSTMEIISFICIINGSILLAITVLINLIKYLFDDNFTNKNYILLIFLIIIELIIIA